MTLSDELMDIPGSQPNFLDALGESEAVRVADCSLPGSQEGHFVAIQSWISGMARSQGMLGGVLCRTGGGTDRYLVVTLWRDQASQQGYVEDIFPS